MADHIETLRRIREGTAGLITDYGRTTADGMDMQEEIEAIDAAITALAQQAGAVDGLRHELQQKCSDWRTYWRAPDAHGVILTKEQAAELLRDALGVEVEIEPRAASAPGGGGEVS